jgi:hypothetical protein
MDWRRARHLASGALLIGALLLGAAVGSRLLLTTTEHGGDPVGRLSAHLTSSVVAAPASRGAQAVSPAEARTEHDVPGVAQTTPEGSDDAAVPAGHTSRPGRSPDD